MLFSSFFLANKQCSEFIVAKGPYIFGKQTVFLAFECVVERAHCSICKQRLKL